jgi:hypothetical protein
MLGFPVGMHIEGGTVYITLRFIFSTVPPESVSIHDASGRLLSGTVGPLREGSELTLSCRARGGKINKMAYFLKLPSLSFAGSAVVFLR